MQVERERPLACQGCQLSGARVVLEVEAVSRNLEGSFNVKKDLEFLTKVYKRVIQPEKTSIFDLELIDFLTLIALSSTLTVKNFGWQTNIKCQNYIENPRFKEIDNEITKIQEFLSNPEISNEAIEEYRQKIEELLKQKEELPKKVKCNTLIQQNINIGNLEFLDPYMDMDKLKVNIADTDYQVKPLTVQKTLELIKIEDKIKQEYQDLVTEDIIEKFLTLAGMLDLDIEKAFNLIINKASPETIDKLVEYQKLLKIGIKPIEVMCPKCFHKNKVYVDIMDIKVYP
jgi:hypothetical protein